MFWIFPDPHMSIAIGSRLPNTSSTHKNTAQLFIHGTEEIAITHQYRNKNLATCIFWIYWDLRYVLRLYLLFCSWWKNCVGVDEVLFPFGVWWMCVEQIRVVLSEVCLATFCCCALLTADSFLSRGASLNCGTVRPLFLVLYCFFCFSRFCVWWSRERNLTVRMHCDEQKLRL